jgi:PhnB protein
MPLQETFWSPRFGMVTDRYGIAWIVNVLPDKGGNGLEIVGAHHS